MSLSLYQVVTLRLHQECEIVDPRPHIHRRVIGYPDSGTWQCLAMIDRIDLYHLVFETFIFGKSGQIQSEESSLQELPKVGVCPEQGVPIQIWVSNKNVDKKYFYCLLYLQLFGKSGQIQSEESSLQELPKVGVCPEEGIPIQICMSSHHLNHEVQLLINIKIGQKRNVVFGNWLNKSQGWKIPKNYRPGGSDTWYIVYGQLQGWRQAKPQSTNCRKWNNLKEIAIVRWLTGARLLEKVSEWKGYFWNLLVTGHPALQFQVLLPRLHGSLLLLLLLRLLPQAELAHSLVASLLLWHSWSWSLPIHPDPDPDPGPGTSSQAAHWTDNTPLAIPL